LGVGPGLGGQRGVIPGAIFGFQETWHSVRLSISVELMLEPALPYFDLANSTC
jgi:hypothetical protein